MLCCCFFFLTLLTLFYQLPPSLRPLGQLLCVGFLYFGTFLNTVHQVIAKSVTIINSLYCALVVSNLPEEHNIQSGYAINNNIRTSLIINQSFPAVGFMDTKTKGPLLNV